MKLRDVEAFIALAETGSVVRAAARLHVTQSAVSRRLKNLEASVDARLIDRRVRPPRITDAGMHLIQQARPLLHAVAELVTGLSRNVSPKGRLRLGVAPGIAESILGSPLDSIVRQFPDVQLKVRSEWSSALLELVRTGELDAAAVLRTEPAGDLPDLSIRPFAADTVVVVASANSRLAAAPSLKAVSALPWVLNPKGCAFRQTLERAFASAGLTLRLCAEIQGYELQLSLVARGAGLALAPLARVRSSRHRRSLREIDVPALRLRVTSALVWPASQAHLLSVLNAFHRCFKGVEHQDAKAA